MPKKVQVVKLLVNRQGIRTGHSVFEPCARALLVFGANEP